MIDLHEYGWPAQEALPAGETPARVIAVHKERYELVCPLGECFGRLKASVYFYGGKEEFPTAGDFVAFLYNPSGDGIILRTLPRRTFFSRRDPNPGLPLEQAVAANFDTVLILQSLNADFNGNRLERYLALAWKSGAQPVVALTKADLPGDHSKMIAAARKAAPGVEVIVFSACTGEGLEQLSPYLLPGKMLVFLGSSGVGKSSLLNRLAGEEWMETGEIRQRDARGRHTTTHRQLVSLPCGAMVIDTPGMRQLGMWEASAGLEQTFPEIEPFLGQCRFSDCRHESEPGCAIRRALEQGLISPERWKSYRQLHEESALSDGKGACRRKKQSARKKRKGGPG